MLAFPKIMEMHLYALLFALMSSTAGSPEPTPTVQAAPTYKKVCQEIEVPMSRMKRRVCKKVEVKQPAPEAQEAEETAADGSAPEPAGE